MAKDTLLIIPALNEERSIKKVLGSLPRERLSEVIVVDNGSTDRTSEFAKMANARVIFEGQKGYGRACLSGILASSHKTPITAFMDADYSDNPQELNLILQKIDQGHDFVLGSRMILKNSRSSLLPQARFGNWFSTFLLKKIYPSSPFSDLGPMRAIKSESLRKLNMEDQDFGWTMEMQIKALKMGLKCAEVPVSYKERIGESKISGTFKGSLLAGIKILSCLIKYTYWKK